MAYLNCWSNGGGEARGEEALDEPARQTTNSILTPAHCRRRRRLLSEPPATQVVDIHWSFMSITSPRTVFWARGVRGRKTRAIAGHQGESSSRLVQGSTRLTGRFAAAFDIASLFHRRGRGGQAIIHSRNAGGVGEDSGRALGLELMNNNQVAQSRQRADPRPFRGPWGARLYFMASPDDGGPSGV